MDFAHIPPTSFNVFKDRIVENQQPDLKKLYYQFASCQQEGELFGIPFDNLKLKSQQKNSAQLNAQPNLQFKPGKELQLFEKE
jgi:hypothetical protein